MSAWTNFISVAGTVTQWLAAWSWQALVLLACVWVGLKVWRTKSPALRHQVWLIALITVTLLPLIAAVVKQIPLSQSNNRALGYVTTIPRAVFETAPAQVPVKNDNLTAITPSPAKSPFRWASAKPYLWAGIFLAWVVGVAFSLLRLWRQLGDLRRLRANAKPVSLAELHCADCRPEMLTAGVGLGLSIEITSPMLAGVRRPVILLPADITDWTKCDERLAMIRHEIAHVERRDHWINVLPTLLNVIFFFHPLVRYACRQLGLERELACDDRVISMGVTAETYAESILKVAERGITQSWTPSGAHQLALFSAKHILERRIEMIMNKDRVRVVARQWKYLILPVAVIAVIAWLLIPAGSAKPGLAQPQANTSDAKLQMVKSLSDNKAYDALMEMALRNPDAELRRLAAIRITELEGDSTGAMLELYRKTDDSEVKRMVIETLARIGEIEPLAKIVLSDPSPEYRELALYRIKWLKENIDSQNIKVSLKENGDRQDVILQIVPSLQDQLNTLQDQPPPPPPPPPPPSQEMTVEAGKPLAPLRWHREKDSVWVLLREAADASIRRDTTFFERVLDEDYRETGPNGETLNKAQAIAEVKRMDYAISKFEFDDLSVSGSLRMAFATFLGTVYFQANGQDSTVQYRYTINFIERDGQLKIAAIHMSRKL